MSSKKLSCLHKIKQCLSMCFEIWTLFYLPATIAGFLHKFLNCCPIASTTTSRTKRLHKFYTDLNGNTSTSCIFLSRPTATLPRIHICCRRNRGFGLGRTSCDARPELMTFVQMDNCITQNAKSCLKMKIMKLSCKNVLIWWDSGVDCSDYEVLQTRLVTSVGIIRWQLTTGT